MTKAPLQSRAEAADPAPGPAPSRLPKYSGATLAALTALVMVAFAANSLLNRAALDGGRIGALDFAAIRLAAGAAMLAALVLGRRGGAARLAAGASWRGALWLGIYMLGFSLAYLSLDAGAGALILFGGVQVTMFAGAVLGGAAVPARRWLGAALALGGLAWLLWPEGEAALSLPHGAMMGAAALGWGLYSLKGRGVSDPLAATAAAFLIATPPALLIALVWGGALPITPSGLLLAIASGAVTSGLGYALWYAVLPRLEASVAALAQLTVPVIAVAGGALLLAEPPGLRLLLACALVLGGVALGILRPRRGGTRPGT